MPHIVGGIERNKEVYKWLILLNRYEIACVFSAAAYMSALRDMSCVLLGGENRNQSGEIYIFLFHDGAI